MSSYMALAVNPPTCPIEAAGGTSKHSLINQCDRRLAFKVRSSNNSNYTVSVVAGFVGVGEQIDIIINRIKGKPKADKLVFLFADVSVHESDPNPPFRDYDNTKKIYGEGAWSMLRAEYMSRQLHCVSVASTNMSVGPEIVKKIEDGYQTLQNAKDCHSLLKKYLTKPVVDELKNKKTKLGATLLDVIQSGVANLDSGVGVYAPDAESYTLFKPLFDPLIQDYHNGFAPNQKQPATDLGEGKTSQLPDLDPEGKFINSTRIRCGRSLDGYPFNPCLTEANYLEMEGKVKKIFDNISDSELQGTYFPLDGMTKEVQNSLIADHFLFKEGDRFLQHANACRYWPKGRGIFHNKNKTFLVWANEEDHLRIISMQNGGNVGQVLERLIKGVKTIGSQAPFSRDERLGWLTFCPSNLGTTVRASVHIRLPKISAKPDFKSICDGLKLQIRGIHGEHSDSEGGVYDISNKARLGLTEFEAVKQMYDGVKYLIELEKKA